MIHAARSLNMMLSSGRMGAVQGTIVCGSEPVSGARVGIYAIDQPAFSTAGPSGKLMRNVLLAAAEFERDMIRQRT